MTSLFPLAEASGLSFLVYLIVGAFWLVGNLLQQKQAKQKALEMKKKREEREAEERRTGKKVQAPASKIESELEAFLGRLSGETVTQPKQPPPIQKQKPVMDDIQFDSAPPPPPPIPAKPKPVKTSNIGDLDLEASFKQISDIKEAVELINGGIDQKLQQDALKNVRSMMIDLSSSSISVPRVPLQTIRAIRTQSPRPNLKNRAAFKQALVASVILQPPKALQANPFEETP
ncbi:hypothetical protein P0Y35_09190 [Kiritimatiellaeota bacterium B1221]|nr:hypothetical protein [Kiritimatiellaeota bacterium B1221]